MPKCGVAESGAEVMVGAFFRKSPPFIHRLPTRRTSIRRVFALNFRFDPFRSFTGEIAEGAEFE